MLCSYHSSDGEGSFEMDGIILFYSVLTKKKKISYSPDFDNFKILFFFLYSERRKRKNFLFSSSLKLGLPSQYPSTRLFQGTRSEDRIVCKIGFVESFNILPSSVPVPVEVEVELRLALLSLSVHPPSPPTWAG